MVCVRYLMPFAGVLALLAQQGAISGPVAGYVFDTRTQSLRTIRGVPGASLIGDAVDFGGVALRDDELEHMTERRCVARIELQRPAEAS